MVGAVQDVKHIAVELDALKVVAVAARAELDAAMAVSAADPQAMQAHEWAESLQRALTRVQINIRAARQIGGGQ